MDIKSFSPTTGRMLLDDGSVWNIADAVVQFTNTSVDANGQKYNLHTMPPHTGRRVMEDGTVVNIANILKDWIEKGGGGSISQEQIEMAVKKYLEENPINMQYKADAIIDTMRGSVVQAADSAEAFMEGLKIFGKSEQDGTPTPESPKEIKSIGGNGEVKVNINTGNLFPLNKFKEYEVNNSAKQITLNGDRILFVGKGTTAKEDIVFFLNKEADKLSLPPGKYTLSFKSNKPYGGTNGENTVEMYLIVEKKSGTVYQSTGNAGKRTVDIEDGDKMYFRFDINNNSMSAEFYDIMFNLGDTPLPYEPHAEQSLAIQTPDGLPGIPVTSGGNYTDSTGQQWVCDEICEQDGVIGVKKYLTEKTIDKNSELNNRLSNYGAVEKNTILTRVADKTLKKTGAILAREFRVKNSWFNDEECAWMTEQGIDFRLSRERLGLAAETTIEENNAAVLKYLETHPLYFVAQLNVPVFEPLPEEVQQKFKALHTYYPTTVVTNNANADMRLDYVADTKLYVKKELEKIVSTQIQKTANLLSLMPLETQAAMIDNDTNNILENMEVQNHE